MRKHILLFCLVSASFLAMQCDRDNNDQDNPLDPGGNNYQVPAKPVLSHTMVSATSDSIYIIAWSLAERAQDYIIEESTTDDFKNADQKVSTILTTQCQHTVLKQPAQYYYRVKGRNGKYEGEWSDTLSVAVVPNTLTISGIVSAVDGASIVLSGDLTDSVTVSDGGSYLFQVYAGGDYTITPARAEYYFTPGNKEFKNLMENVTQNYDSAKKPCISGTISGTDSVMVTLSGDKTETQIVNNGESYSFMVEYGGNYVVTPSKVHYAFTLSSTAFENVTSNQTQNFTALTYTISGTVTGADGVTVTLSGDETGSRTINSGGSYSFTVGGVGSYTVTPSKEYYAFSPENQTFSNMSANQSQNFTASKNKHTISGTVTGIAGVNVTLTGMFGVRIIAVSTDGGSYSFTVNEGGTYTITPSKTGCTFSPASQTFTNVTSDRAQNFTAITYTISGTVTGADNVTVTLSGSSSGSQLVNDGGTYSFTVGSVGSYKITPVKSGYAFFPQFQTLMNVTSNQTQNFTSLFSPIAGFVSIPGGTFQMGNVENASEGDSDEKPVHTVTLTGFMMSVHEVTNAQYCAYLNTALATGNIEVKTDGDVYGKTGAWSGQRFLDIGYGSGQNMCWITYSSGIYSVTSGYEDWPVVAVSWYGAKSFADYYGFDLPTESEWEYACRGGYQYKYGTDDGTISGTKVNYYGNVHNPVIVSSYPPNPYGLHDMSGNVEEWCHDWYGAYTSESVTDPTGAQTGSKRVVRGGNYNHSDYGCRSASRNSYSPNNGYGYLGFRVVRRQSGVVY